MRRLMLWGIALGLLRLGSAVGATYYVDFDAGLDTNAGASPEAPWKHAPGDAAATDAPRKAGLTAGDTVRFKGGVVYRGSINLACSGTRTAPIVYDGNLDGSWGQGKAIVDGSAEEAGAYEVAIMHGSEMPGKRQVLVNGDPVKGLEAVHFPSTGSWVTWQEMGLEVPLMLKAGRNVIRFVNVSGHHNFKVLRFIPVSVE